MALTVPASVRDCAEDVGDDLILCVTCSCVCVCVVQLRAVAGGLAWTEMHFGHVR
jgi:hypothetical protein